MTSSCYTTATQAQLKGLPKMDEKSFFYAPCRRCHGSGKEPEDGGTMMIGLSLCGIIIWTFGFIIGLIIGFI